jgi:predicted nucleotidyltransferase component of viral defense system
MTSPQEQSFKKLLQLVAKERDITPAEVWQNVITERFLVRLCNSPYYSHFILKGGMLLAKHVKLGRETKDLDFTIEHLSNEINSLQRIFGEITSIEVEDDFVFANPTVTLLEHFHMQYPGAQVKMKVHFGKASFPLFIDLGFGDLVKAHEKKVMLVANSKGPLFESSLTLKCYPIEFVFAEKLETVIYRGPDNSRMKDFHDLYTMISKENILDKEETKSAILAVFNHRKTHLELPIQFDTSTFNALQVYWARYRQTVTAGKTLPDQIEQVLGVVNEWLT